MTRYSLLDRIHKHLFEDKEQLDHMSDHEQGMLRRYEAAMTLWLDKPSLSDKQIRIYLMNHHGISERQAYIDIANMKYLLGNVTNARKEWQRYKILYMLDKAYKLAEKDNDIKGMIMAADRMGKYTQLDQQDAQMIPWDQIVPQPFEPTSDPSVIGLKPIPNLEERIKKLKKHYESEIDISDAQIIPPEQDEE